MLKTIFNTLTDRAALCSEVLTLKTELAVSRAREERAWAEYADFAQRTKRTALTQPQVVEVLSMAGRVCPDQRPALSDPKQKEWLWQFAMAIVRATEQAHAIPRKKEMKNA